MKVYFSRLHVTQYALDNPKTTVQSVDLKFNDSRTFFKWHNFRGGDNWRMDSIR